MQGTHDMEAILAKTIPAYQAGEGSSGLWVLARRITGHGQNRVRPVMGHSGSLPHIQTLQLFVRDIARFENTSIKCSPAANNRPACFIDQGYHSIVHSLASLSRLHEEIYAGKQHPKKQAGR